MIDKNPVPLQVGHLTSVAFAGGVFTAGLNVRRQDAAKDMAQSHAVLSTLSYAQPACIGVPHDRQRNDHSNFHSGVSRGRRIASSGMLALVSQR
jgi:hypothetical protein